MRARGTPMVVEMCRYIYDVLCNRMQHESSSIVGKFTTVTKFVQSKLIVKQTIITSHDPVPYLLRIMSSVHLRVYIIFTRYYMYYHDSWSLD